VILPDVNVLIYAFRQDSPQHKTSKAWLDTIVASDARFGVSELVLSAVVRIATNPRIFVQPSSLEESFGYCESLLSQPHCEVIRPGERHWELFSRLCRETGTKGPRVSDAWFAALAIEHGCTWITYDRDFARFPELDWQAPSA
jgi:toxin-antitoxin system PIN domain toxin